MAPPPRPSCRTPQGAPSPSKHEDAYVDADEDGNEGGNNDVLMRKVMMVRVNLR